MELSVFAETLELDQKAYETIIARLFEEKLGVNKYIFRRLEKVSFNGKGDLIKQLPLVLLRIIQKFPNIENIVVIIDADGSYPQVTNKEKNKVKARLKSFMKDHPIKLCVGVPTYNIEAWLLSDVGNIMQSTGLLKIDPYPLTEEIHESKTELKRIYSLYRNKRRKDHALLIPYSEFVIELCKTINFDTLKRSSKTFSNFLTDLKALFTR